MSLTPKTTPNVGFVTRDMLFGRPTIQTEMCASKLQFKAVTEQPTLAAATTALTVTIGTAELVLPIPTLLSTRPI